MPRLTQVGSSLGFGLALAVILAGAVVSNRNTVRVRDNVELVARSHEVVAKVARVMSLLTDAETGQRGYIITGEEEYLEPYNRGRAHVKQAADALEALVAGDPAQRQRMVELHRQIDDRLAGLEEGIDLRRDRGVEAARQYVLSGRGKAAMDATRAAVDEMEAAELHVLQLREDESERAYNIAQWAELAIVAASLSAIGLAYHFVNRELRARRRAERDLAESNAELERRVERRTAELTSTNAALEREVAERRRAETRVQEFADELQRSNRELEQFATVASHDLQEPLRKIEAFSDRLRKGLRERLGDAGSQDVDRIVDSARRMRRLIEALLAYSRVTRRGRPFARVDLTALARDVVDDLGERIERSGGRVELGALPTIEADPLQMQQLLQNLIANALKFHKPGEPPLVRVEAEIAPGDDGGTCVLRVRDEGIGFEPVYAERIFNVFERLHGRTEFEGTGIGLAICRRIVERHGGSIEAFGEPGRGATFEARWPARPIANRDVA